MAADCEQIRGRMLELLYGELAADARAEVAAHVAGCEACRAELAALESTRALARRALAADAPPPRARAAILQAATTATRARSPLAMPSKPSFWSRFRGRWTLPTFATVGAIAVFLLASRIFLDPEKTYQRGRAAMAPTGAVPTAAAPVPARAMEEQKRAEESAREAEPAAASRHAHGVAHRHAAAAAAPAAAAPEGAFAPPPPPRRDMDDLLQDKAAPREMEVQPAKKKAGRASEEAAPAAAPAPPPPMAASAPRLPPAAPAPAAATAAAAAPAPRPAARAVRAPAKAEAPLDNLGEAASGSGAVAQPESPAARADRLFAQHRWTEAATAYRQLLRDAPASPNAARWRQRLADCQAALRQ